MIVPALDLLNGLLLVHNDLEPNLTEIIHQDVLLYDELDFWAAIQAFEPLVLSDKEAFDGSKSCVDEG